MRIKHPQNVIQVKQISKEMFLHRVVIGWLG